MQITSWLRKEKLSLLKGRRWQNTIYHAMLLYILLFCLTCACFLPPALDSLSHFFSLWGFRSSCVVLFPGDGHTCVPQVVHLAAELGTPGQAERQSLQALLSVCVCMCVCNSLGDFWRAQLKLWEDNGCLCTQHTHTHTNSEACVGISQGLASGMFGLVSVAMRSSICVCVCVYGEGVYLQFYLFWSFFISRHNKPH